MNISEFASIAGVSRSAVSRYFNGGYLSQDKRDRIVKAIQETGYSPSASAQSVRTRVTKLVGVILPKLSSESCARVAEGISTVLEEEGYQLLLVNTGNNYNKEIEYLDLFRQNRVDGVIFLASIFTPLHHTVLRKMHIPVVIVAQSCQGYNCVCHNDFGAAYELTQHMLKKGAERPGYIGVTLDDHAAGKARYEGFMQAIQEAGLLISRQHQSMAEFKIESGYASAKHIFSKPPYPDALFCATDSIAAGAMLYCKENSIRIPEDVMVCAVGDSKMGRVTTVPLTSAHLHYKTSGIEAARMLLGEIQHKGSVPKTIQLDYTLVFRTSTGD